MDSLPIDMSHPAVRDYLALVRLQVLMPLSLLINIATVLVCAVIANPSIGGILKRYPSSISPNPAVIAVYVLAIYVGQFGFCLLLVLARKPETKKTLVKGVGLTLVLANWVMAGWAVAWVLKWFLVSTILQGLLVLLLLYSNITLLIYHAPTSLRPFDTALIHAPLRFFLILPLSLTFPYSLFITLGLTYKGIIPGLPIDYTAHPWPGFGVVFGTNLLGLIVIALRRDIVWCVAATWICASIWSLRPKPAPVYITVIIFTVLHPLALFASFIYSRFYSGRRVALPPDDEHPGLYPNRGQSGPREEESAVENRGPREVDPDIWN